MKFSTFFLSFLFWSFSFAVVKPIDDRMNTGYHKLSFIWFLVTPKNKRLSIRDPALLNDLVDVADQWGRDNIDDDNTGSTLKEYIGRILNRRSGENADKSNFIGHILIGLLVNQASSTTTTNTYSFWFEDDGTSTGTTWIKNAANALDAVAGVESVEVIPKLFDGLSAELSTFPDDTVGQAFLDLPHVRLLKGGNTVLPTFSITNGVLEQTCTDVPPGCVCGWEMEAQVSDVMNISTVGESSVATSHVSNTTLELDSGNPEGTVYEEGYANVVRRQFIYKDVSGLKLQMHSFDIDADIVTQLAADMTKTDKYHNTSIIKHIGDFSGKRRDGIHIPNTLRGFSGRVPLFAFVRFTTESTNVAETVKNFEEATFTTAKSQSSYRRQHFFRNNLTVGNITAKVKFHVLDFVTNVIVFDSKFKLQRKPQFP